MIGKLRGILEIINDDSLIIDVGGVGYIVFCSGETINKLPAKGSEISLLIETHVREDHIHLYGFAEKLEREWFLNLLNVQGVGTKMAMAILSALTPTELISALVAQDKNAFRQISGVGPKLSERLIIELKGKVKSVNLDSLPKDSGSGKTIAGKSAGSINDAISALINLGYQRTEAYNAVTRIAANSDKPEVSELIRLSLKELGR